MSKLCIKDYIGIINLENVDSRILEIEKQHIQNICNQCETQCNVNLDELLNINKENLTWQYEKFKDKTAIYAICPVCNFIHDSSKSKCKLFELKVIHKYKFCPECGTYLHTEEDVEIIMDERWYMERNKEV